MSILAELVVQSRSRVTHTAARLERRGWVRRDARPPTTAGACCSGSPTTAATAIERFAVVHVTSVRRHLVDVLTPEQFAALGTTMQALRDAYAADPDDARRTLLTGADPQWVGDDRLDDRPTTAASTDAPASAALLARARAVTPGGVNSPVRAFRAVGGTPRFMASGRGPVPHRRRRARLRRPRVLAGDR